MIVGVPKEIKPDEYRVAMVPAGAEELTRSGHTVLIQSGAGAGSGIPDEQYAANGAQIVASAADVWSRADLVVKVKTDPEQAPISDKLKALLVIAGKTAESGKAVTADDITRARERGATDLEIHDTVLIAAVFCMCNRYVDGLATWAPDDPDFYRQRAAIVARNGYASSTLQGPS